MDTDRLAMRFYSSLFVRYPHLRALFPGDLTDLATKIVGVFELVVFSFQEGANGHYHLQQELLQPLRALGLLHEQKGVQDSHYPMVNQMLLESVRAETADFDDEMELAWKLALNHLTVAMITGAGSIEEGDSTIHDSFRKIRMLLFKTGENN